MPVKYVSRVDGLIKWHTLFDLIVLTDNGSSLGHQIACVFKSGSWAVYDKDDNRLEGGEEISVFDAKAKASLSAIDLGLLRKNQ